MYRGKKILGVIPARSGSKAIPDKNIQLLGGVPLITRVALQATEAKEIDELIISTDSQKYANLLQEYGVGSPFIRSEELSTDKSLIVETLINLLTWNDSFYSKKFDYLCLVQPTACFALAQDYTKAIKKAVDSKADTVISVEPCGQKHPAIMFTLNAEGNASWLIASGSGPGGMRRQDLPPVYIRAGNAYVFNIETMLKTQSLYGGSIYAIEIPSERCLDIDTPEDLEYARWKVERKSGK